MAGVVPVAVKAEPVVLKSDLFGSISRHETEAGPVILRDTRTARPWLGWLARRLARREARALARLGGLPGTPRLVNFDGVELVRTWIAGEPMHRARPADAAYYREALGLIRRIHRAGLTHNDLAKETNWLVTPTGRPALVDFQLAIAHRQFVSLARSLCVRPAR